MHECDTLPPVTVGRTAEGGLTYLVNLSPAALPPVRLRDLDAAWEAARAAAIAGRWGPPRLFRFRRPDGSVADLALADADACCWAAAVDATVGMGSAHGVSLCLRLLALVELLARRGPAARLVRLKRDGAELDPRLLRAAARAPLTDEARFDERDFPADAALAAPSPAPLRIRA